MEPQDKNSQPAPLPPESYPPPYFYAQPGMQDDEIDLRALAQTLWNHKRLVIGFSVIVASVALVASLVMTPVYRSSTLLAPVNAGDAKSSLGALASQFGGLAALAGVTLPGGGNVDTSIATIKSRKLLLAFVEENDLKPILFSDRWDRNTKKWVLESPGFFSRIKEFIFPSKLVSVYSESLVPGEPTSNETYNLIMKDVLFVEKDVATSLVTLSIDWEEPLTASNWANLLVARVNKELRESAVADSERSIAYLTEQLNHITVSDLRAVLFRMIEEHTKNMTLAKTQQEYAFKVIDPAVPSDIGDKVSPKRGLITLLGALFGGLVGVFVVFLRAGVRNNDE